MSKSVSELADLLFAYYPKMRKLYRSLVSIKDIPISMTQLTCIYIIDRHDGLSMSELADDLCMSNQQLTKIVDALVELQLVERVCDPANRRKFFAKSTEKGKTMLANLKTEVERKLGYVLHKKSPDEIDKLYESFAYVASYLGFKNE